MCKVLVGNEIENHITINILGKTYPESKDYGDGNWLGSEIYFSLGAFNGSIKAHLRSSEFETFLEKVKILYDKLKGVAEYSSMEGWLSIKITGDGRGHMLIEGVICDDPDIGNKLIFIINYDQTGLKNTLEGLEYILEKYPVIGK